jgi:hypothetical protein
VLTPCWTVPQGIKGTFQSKVVEGISVEVPLGRSRPKSRFFSFVKDIDAVIQSSKTFPNEHAVCLLLKAKVLVAMRQVEVSSLGLMSVCAFTIQCVLIDGFDCTAIFLPVGSPHCIEKPV